MKKILLAFIALLISYGASAQKEEGPNNEPKIEFQQSELNFGEIQEGESIEHTFMFKNTGIKPLFISGASTTCECVVVEFPRKPVTKGKTGTIKVTFNSSGKIGVQNKLITVESNAVNAEERILMKGKVLPENRENR